MHDSCVRGRASYPQRALLGASTAFTGKGWWRLFASGCCHDQSPSAPPHTHHHHHHHRHRHHHFLSSAARGRRALGTAYTPSDPHMRTHTQAYHTATCLSLPGEGGSSLPEALYSLTGRACRGRQAGSQAGRQAGGTRSCSGRHRLPASAPHSRITMVIRALPHGPCRARQSAQGRAHSPLRHTVERACARLGTNPTARARCGFRQPAWGAQVSRVPNPEGQQRPHARTR